jgi:acetyl-CoA carboxylase biotin carboxyl carrier protein
MNRIPMDPDAIRALAGILTETGLTEIEIASKDTRIRVVRAPGPIAYGEHHVVPPAPPRPPIVPVLPDEPVASSDEADHPGAVTSPMVGVVFLSPEPGAPPFVTAGQQVEAGQTLLLIEAMKTFNQIKAARSGILARILVANGAPVEYGEVLMILEP